MKVLSIDEMLAVYILSRLEEDFVDAKPQHSVTFVCRDSRFRELLEHWLKCKYKDDNISVTVKNEVIFYLEIFDDECPTKFTLRLLQGKEILVTLLDE